MGRGDDTPADGFEFLDVDPAGGDVDEVLAIPEPRWPRWIPALVATGVIAALITLVVRIDNQPSASPTRTPTAAPSSISGNGISPTSVAPVPPITVTTVDAPLLGVQAGWELFGRGDHVVVRIQFAQGRITRTAVPDLLSSGPVSFIVGTHQAIVRPLDVVPGYRIPDGRPARQIDMSLSVGQTGPAFPGPDPDHVWAPPAGEGQDDIRLAGMDDPSFGPRLPVPSGVAVTDATPDGAGFLLFQGSGGVYDSRPGELRRITTGQVLAVGPTRWLVRECGGRTGRCRTVVIDQADGKRHVIATAGPSAGYILAGAISPDGSTAALVPGTGSPQIKLMNLSTGTVRSLLVRVDESAFDPSGVLAWSPDSRWLFATDENSHLNAIDVRTEHVVDLTYSTGRALPPLTQIAIRAAP
ncbi:MAG: hypothetical protein ABI345_05960 [Jatrophihabitans sp.]